MKIMVKEFTDILSQKVDDGIQKLKSTPIETIQFERILNNVMACIGVIGRLAPQPVSEPKAPTGGEEPK